jgi:hypothetical protein
VIDVAYWHVAAPDVCDGASEVRESRHRIPSASLGRPTEPCLVDVVGSNHLEQLMVIAVVHMHPTMTGPGASKAFFITGATS